jgi:hypothetical protein
VLGNLKTKPLFLILSSRLLSGKPTRDFLSSVNFLHQEEEKLQPKNKLNTNNKSKAKMKNKHVIIRRYL